MLKFTSKKNLLISLFIFLTFFLGFIFQENSAGGGKIDNIHITNNFILFENNNFFEIQWSLYSSSTLPIYYLIAGIFYQYNPLFIKVFNFTLSLCSIYIFNLILKLKFNIKKENNNILILSCLPLLSPYFRTSTFWGLEEITAYFFFLSSVFFFYIFFKKKLFFFIYFLFFFFFLFFFLCLNLIFLLFFFYFFI